MADEKKEKWLSILPATTVVIAVCATLSTFKGGGYSTKSMLSQSKASDQWAFYQAKSIKAALYDMQRESLELSMMNQHDAAYSAELAKRITSYGEKIKKYGDEKEQITKIAKGFEDVQIESKKHSEAFGVAVIFLQIAILLSSIAALIKKSSLWYVGIIVAAVGIVYFFNGFFLFL